MIETVAIVGAGTMGSQIALQTALSGRYDVRLVDSEPSQLERARGQNGKLVEKAVARGRVEPGQGAKALELITESTDLESAVTDAQLVIEAIYENVDAKREVFKRADQAAPADAILASNSSSIVISRLAEVTGRPDRCCNLHFFHPVTVMELCEVGRGPETSEATVEAATEFVRSIARVPVQIQKEIHGFLVNRILFAASEEALRLLEGGYATAADIDLAVKKGLNWPMGPFELMDFSGIDIVYGALLDRQRSGGPEPSPILREKVAAGHLGRKTGRGFYEY